MPLQKNYWSARHEQRILSGEHTQVAVAQLSSGAPLGIDRPCASEPSSGVKRQRFEVSEISWHALMGNRERSGISKNTLLVAVGSFFSDLSTEMLTPVLPIFLTQTLNASGSIVGLVDGIAQAVRNLIDGFSGSMSDKLRKRKVIVLAGYAMAAISKPFMGLSTIWEAVLAARILDRLGAGVRSAPRDALVASSVDKQERGGGFGLEGLGEHAGAFVGPILTVLLLYALQVDIRIVFYVAFIPGLLALAIVLLVRERSPPDSVRQRIVHPRELPTQYWKYLVAIAIFSIGNSSNAFLILRTQEVGASVLITTLVYAGFNLVAALVSYPLTALSDRWGRKLILLGSCIVFLAAYAGFALADSFTLIVLLFLLYGIYQGSFRSVGRVFASDLAPEQMRASGIGWFSATVGLCQLIASLVAGFLWDHFGHTAPFILGVGSAAAGILAIAVLMPREHRSVNT
jgi:MFS family permease